MCAAEVDVVRKALDDIARNLKVSSMWLQNACQSACTFPLSS